MFVPSLSWQDHRLQNIVVNSTITIQALSLYTQASAVFFSGSLKSFSATCWYTARAMYNLQVRQTPFKSHVYIQNDQCTKTGSGQIIGKVENKAFPAG